MMVLNIKRTIGLFSQPFSEEERGSHLPHVTLMPASGIARAVIELVRERISITYITSTHERIASPSLT